MAARLALASASDRSRKRGVRRVGTGPKPVIDSAQRLRNLVALDRALKALANRPVDAGVRNEGAVSHDRSDRQKRQRACIVMTLES